jgi:hypothetical protein
MHHFSCPHCKTTLEHDETITGETIQCGECHEVFIVGELTSTTQTAKQAVTTPNAAPRETTRGAPKKPFPVRAVTGFVLFCLLCIGAALFIRLKQQTGTTPTLATPASDASDASDATKTTDLPATQITIAEQTEDTQANLAARELTPGADGNATVHGLLHAKQITSTQMKYTLSGNAHQPTFKLAKPKTADINLDDYADQLVEVTGKPVELVRNGNKLVKITEIVRVEKLSAEATAAYYATFDRAFDAAPNAKAFMGTWGPRVCIPSGQNPERVETFDVKHLAKQISMLDSAAYVMVNVTQPSGGCYYTGPHPELSKALQLERPSFPTRDVLGIVLDEIQASGKKALVYFGAKAMHANRAEEQTKAAWNQHIATLGLNHVEATRELLIKHYAKRYGTKIAGWWFDGSEHIKELERILWRQTIHAYNPAAIIAFNRMAGPPYRSTRQCDFFGGHTTPIVVEPFWSMVNEPMITDIERSPWMGLTDSSSVEEGYGALGHAFLGMQNKWTMGKCRFPPKQAIDWTTRVLHSGGMFTWAVPMDQPIAQIPESQFKLLKLINRSVRQLRAKTAP